MHARSSHKTHKNENMFLMFGKEIMFDVLEETPAEKAATNHIIDSSPMERERDDDDATVAEDGVDRGRAGMGARDATTVADGGGGPKPPPTTTTGGGEKASAVGGGSEKVEDAADSAPKASKRGRAGQRRGSKKRKKASYREVRELRPSPYFHYVDRSRDADADPLGALSPALSAPNFVIKLHAILIREELQGVVDWMPHGRSWKILDQVGVCVCFWLSLLSFLGPPRF